MRVVAMFVNYLKGKGYSESTIKLYRNAVVKLLRERGLDLTEEEIKEHIKAPSCHTRSVYVVAWRRFTEFLEEVKATA